VDQLRILERRMSWWTERLVESDEPTIWFLTAAVGEQRYEGLDALEDAIGTTRPKRVAVQWALVVEGRYGEQIGARISGTVRRHQLRRARLTISGTDPVFADRMARELSHSRWRLRRFPLPVAPINSVADLVSANLENASFT
jgi:hypothetical protein